MAVTPDKNVVVLFDAASGGWLAFDQPIRVIVADTVGQVAPALLELDREAAQGRWAAGFLAYEAAPAFDAAFETRPDAGFPLLWFGIYTHPERMHPPGRPGIAREIPWQPSIGEHDYRTRFDQIKQLIAAGDTYQVNFSFRLRAPFDGDSWDLFRAMAHAQGSGYPAYVDTGDLAIASASPELFFSLDGERLVSKPMKGTTSRGLRLSDDEALACRLANSEKDRAENLMIVDMVRNDLGRIAQAGSVEVSHLFALEKYPTLWQMTSTVECRTTASIPAIFQALFPPASITGAPKVRTMQIIAALETDPRKIYTGAIGYLAPGRRAQFNVAIRTVAIDRRAGEAEYGTGGGIVWDSQASGELEECFTKARVLTQPQPEFSLLETVRWSPQEGYHLLEEHLARLRDSARYFSRPLDLEWLRQQLTKRASGFPPEPQRVRILVPAQDCATIENHPIDLLPHPYRLRLAAWPVKSRDAFLYHKTTHRQVYQSARSDAPDCDDVLLWNERGELTESTIANVVLELDGKLLTPPVVAGLLPGIERARLVAAGTLTEATLRVEDLARAERIWLLNSLRGRWEAITFQRTDTVRSPSKSRATARL